MTMIIPTVGRIVLFREQAMRDPEQPWAAIITRVWNERLIDINIFHPTQGAILRRATLIQEGETPPDSGGWAEWMPYQIGQAKRAAVQQDIARQGYEKL